jgi:hypothetical protein
VALLELMHLGSSQHMRGPGAAAAAAAATVVKAAVYSHNTCFYSSAIRELWLNCTCLSTRTCFNSLASFAA